MKLILWVVLIFTAIGGFLGYYMWEPPEFMGMDHGGMIFSTAITGAVMGLPAGIIAWILAKILAKWVV